MTIQPIGSTSVALYITPADLKERGLTPSGLTLERALELITYSQDKALAAAAWDKLQAAGEKK